MLHELKLFHDHTSGIKDFFHAIVRRVTTKTKKNMFFAICEVLVDYFVLSDCRVRSAKLKMKPKSHNRGGKYLHPQILLSKSLVDPVQL